MKQFAIVRSDGEIPFVDLSTPHLELEDELLSVFRAAVRSGAFIGGPPVEDFEREFAEYCTTRYCVGVGSGTDALRFALIAAGVRPNDIVVTVPNTFIATTEAISQAGAVPEFVDIDERTFNMDPKKLQHYLESQCENHDASGRTINRKSRQPVTAVIPVHLYGQMANMDPILEIAARYNLIVIEDACQAHGAEYFSKSENRWTRAGSVGRVAAFSFYPGKNLGACGEAGAVTTNDPDIAQNVRMLRDHGQSQKYYHDTEGYNGRLDALQAGILRIKLRHLPGWNRKRRENAYCYDGLFGSAVGSIRVPYEPPWSRAAYHLYVIRTLKRDQLKMHLAGANISTGIHYPIPLHLQKAYRTLGYKEGDFPVSEKAASEILSLPMYPQLGFDRQCRIARTVTQFLSRSFITKCDAQLLRA
ncbi:MAG TPA: DegT/DnrJ/EryC1/StrS family aminotransferase [Acidobacteriota bacterium]|jgi:dTDP-4-amino-4,6-dideoxygalactose transaminase